VAKDLYSILGVSRTASTEEIRSAFRKLARKHHPDVNPGNPKAEERFKELAAAFEVLSDPMKREAYDQFGEASLEGGFDPERARQYREWQSTRQATGHPFAGEAFDFDLGDLFGDVIGRARARSERGEDVLARVDLDLAQAIRGAEVELPVPVEVPCTTCNGSGNEPGTTPTSCPECRGTGKRDATRGPMHVTMTCQTCAGTGVIRTPCKACGGRGAVVSSETAKVRIPPGADEGTQLRVRGRGAAGQAGAPRGDLIIETHVRPHPFFRRDGLDLYLTLPVTLDEALSGAIVDVPTPDGTVRLKVPPHSQTGSRLRLRGKGVRRGDQRGDLYAVIDVRLPDREDEKLAEAARAARSAYNAPVREGVRL
jgi:molecular chaperone DnaJ